MGSVPETVHQSLDCIVTRKSLRIGPSSVGRCRKLLYAMGEMSALLYRVCLDGKECDLLLMSLAEMRAFIVGTSSRARSGYLTIDGSDSILKAGAMISGLSGSVFSKNEVVDGGQEQR